MGKRTAIKVPIETIIASVKYVGDLPKPEFCNVPNCARPSRSMSLCKAHYNDWQRYKQGQPRVNPDWEELKQYALDPIAVPTDFKIKDRYCHVPSCLRGYEARGLCILHYRRLMKGLKNEKLGSK